MELKRILPLLIVTSSSLGTTILDHENSFSYVQTVDIFSELNEYFSLSNNIIDDEERDMIFQDMDYKLKEIIFRLHEIIGDTEIDYEKDIPVYDYLRELRKRSEYEILLNQFSRNNKDIIKCILIFLSGINFKNLFAFEEKFVIEILKLEDIELQEYALNTITIWNNLSDVNQIKNIKIANKYLNDDLQEFLSNF